MVANVVRKEATMWPAREPAGRSKKKENGCLCARGPSVLTSPIVDFQWTLGAAVEAKQPQLSNAIHPSEVRPNVATMLQRRLTHGHAGQNESGLHAGLPQRRGHAGDYEGGFYHGHVVLYSAG